MIYSHFIKLPNGLIVYENKDDSKANGLLPELKIFNATYNEEAYNDIYKTFKSIAACNHIGALAQAPDVCPNYFCEIKCKKDEPKKSKKLNKAE
jgi:hypothetical protein